MPRRRNMSLFLLIVVHDATLYQERRKTHIARNIFLFRGVQAEQLPAFCKLLSDFRNVRRVAEACYLGFRPLGLIGADRCRPRLAVPCRRTFLFAGGLGEVEN